jgi:hypothetical protein
VLPLPVRREMRLSARTRCDRVFNTRRRRCGGGQAFDRGARCRQRFTRCPSPPSAAVRHAGNVRADILYNFLGGYPEDKEYPHPAESL